MASKQIKVSGLIAAGTIKDPGPIQGDSIVDIVATMDVPTNESKHYVDLPLDLIDDSPYQPRSVYRGESIDDLGHTLASAGQKEPIQVRPVGTRYELIAGHRRLRAARNLGWTTIKAYVIHMNDQEAELATLVHNEGREDLCDYERGKAFSRALSRGLAKNQSDCAAKFATSQAVVSKCIGMSKLPQPIVQMLESKHDLFGYNCSETIHKLVAEYPNRIELITEAVGRLNSGADQNGIRSWVEQMIGIGSRKKGPTPLVITDDSGKQIFSAVLDGRVLTVKISDPTIDANMVQKRVSEKLSEISKSTNVEIE